MKLACVPQRISESSTCAFVDISGTCIDLLRCAGDGLICSFAIEGGEVLARRKFVRTADMRAEMAAGTLSQVVPAARASLTRYMPVLTSVRRDDTHIEQTCFILAQLDLIISMKG